MEVGPSRRTIGRIWSCVSGDDKENSPLEPLKIANQSRFDCLVRHKAVSRSSECNITATSNCQVNRRKKAKQMKNRKRIDASIYAALNLELMPSTCPRNSDFSNQISNDSSGKENQVLRSEAAEIPEQENENRNDRAYKPHKAANIEEKKLYSGKETASKDGNISCDVGNSLAADNEMDDYDIDFSVQKINETPPKCPKSRTKKERRSSKHVSLISLSDSDSEIADNGRTQKRIASVQPNLDGLLSKGCFELKSSRKKIKKKRAEEIIDPTQRTSQRSTMSVYHSDDDDIISTTANISIQKPFNEAEEEALQACNVCDEPFPKSKVAEHTKTCLGLVEETSARLSAIGCNARKRPCAPARSTSRLTKPSKAAQGSKKLNSKKSPLVFEDWQNACEKLQGTQTSSVDNQELEKSERNVVQENKILRDQSDKPCKNPDVSLNSTLSKKVAAATELKTRNIDRKITTHVEPPLLDKVQHSIETQQQKPKPKVQAVKRSSKKANVGSGSSSNLECSDDSNDSIVYDVINQYLEPNPIDVDELTVDIAGNASVNSPADIEKCFICGKSFPSGRIYQKHVEYEVKKMNSKVSPKQKLTRKSTRYNQATDSFSDKVTADGVTLAERLGSRKSWSAFQFNQNKTTNPPRETDDNDDDIMIHDDDIDLSPIKSFTPIGEHSSFDFSNQFSNNGKPKRQPPNRSSRGKWNGRRPRYKTTRKRR